MSSTPRPLTALVLSGGGARGAYEAGVIHYLRTALPNPQARKHRFDILCGSSVGAINTAFMAASAHDLEYQGQRLFETWSQIRQEDIYRRDVASLFSLVFKSLGGMSRNLFRKAGKSLEGNPTQRHFRGVLDTSPFLPFLNDHIPWRQISLNLQNDLLKAVSITGTNIHTGMVELFIEKQLDLPYTGPYTVHETKIEAHHVMASAALPFIFPAIRVNRQYYMDGSLRLNTPMSPAIQLGAEKILVVGMHNTAEREQRVAENTLFAPIANTPTLGSMLGKVLNSIFLDKLDYDIEQMTRINRIIDWGEGRFGSDFVEQINQYLQDNNIRGDIANRGLKRLKVMHISPSRDLREVFAKTALDHNAFLKSLTRSEKWLLKMMDVDLSSSRDFLSYIIFAPEYISELMRQGFEDAKAKASELEAFLSEA